MFNLYDKFKTKKTLEIVQNSGWAPKLKSFFLCLWPTTKGDSLITFGEEVTNISEDITSVQISCRR